MPGSRYSPFDPPKMPLRGIATLVVALSAALQAVSQGSNVTCSSQYAWVCLLALIPQRNLHRETHR